MRAEDLVHFCAPGRLIIRPGARHELPALLARLGHRHGLLVTDRFFTQNTPWVREYVEAAQALGVETLVYDGGMPDPTTVLCDSATDEVQNRLGGKALDHVLALGGGSNIDLAKALCLTLPSGKPICSFVGQIPPGTEVLPLIALPTTSGAGSEATPGAILVDPQNATKIAVMDNALRPCIALVDPEFTYTCPARVTADSGIDALVHAVESFLTQDSAVFEREGNVDPGYSGRSALTMIFARESIRLCAAYLERAYRDGNDREARIGMSYASVYAALSYGSAGLNAVHGIAYGIAGLTHKTHGQTNAVIFPYVLDALRGDRGSELREVATLFGISGSDEDVRLVHAMRDLVDRLGIPTNLADFGIREEQLDTLLGDALGVTRLLKAFPVPDAQESYRRIIQNAWHGRLGRESERATPQPVGHERGRVPEDCCKP